MATVWVPSLLQRYTGGAETLDVPGHNVRRILQEIVARYPALREPLLREDDQLQEGLAVAVDGAVATMGMLEPVGERSEVHIIPAVGGGSLFQVVTHSFRDQEN
jgi:molybdopterin converting factor small subunit